MWRECDVKIYPGKIRDKELRKAYEKGMVGKYTMDVGWERSYTIYNVYGESGGTNDNITTTEALLQGCIRDRRTGVCNPTMWVGDFNAEPNKLGPVQELIKEERWTDVGHRARWWGQPADHWTCHQRHDAKKPRIDGIVVDSETLGTIHNFEVENQTFFPTHNTLRLELSRNAFKGRV